MWCEITHTAVGVNTNTLPKLVPFFHKYDGMQRATQLGHARSSSILPATIMGCVNSRVIWTYCDIHFVHIYATYSHTRGVLLAALMVASTERYKMSMLTSLSFNSHLYRDRVCIQYAFNQNDHA